MAAVVQLGNALLTDLTNTLTGKTHLSTNLLQTALLATYAEALANDFQFTVLQYTAQHVLQIRSQRLIVYLLVSTRVIAGTQHISH